MKTFGKSLDELEGKQDKGIDNLEELVRLQA